MKYCSHCAAPVKHRIPENDDRPRFICANCGIVHYQNPKIVVGTIPQWGDTILLCQRNIAPRRNTWTLPAGYLENGETVMQGACRETLEETGAQVDTLAPYLLLDIVHINQIYLIFRARLNVPEFQPTAESKAVRLFQEKDIPWDNISFEVIDQTLKQFFVDRKKHRYPFQVLQISPHSSSNKDQTDQTAC